MCDFKYAGIIIFRGIHYITRNIATLSVHLLVDSFPGMHHITRKYVVRSFVSSCFSGNVP